MYVVCFRSEITINNVQCSLHIPKVLYLNERKLVNTFSENENELHGKKRPNADNVMIMHEIPVCILFTHLCKMSYLQPIQQYKQGEVLQ